MKSKMSNSSRSTNDYERVQTANSTIDSMGNHGDLREIKNQGYLREVNETSGNKERINLGNS